MSSLTEGQSKALVLIPKFSAPLSILGSSCILYQIYKDKKSWSKPGQRLLFAMSLNDVVSSFWLFLSTWPVPEESGRWMASGNMATCRAQGFFGQINIISPIYNGMIAIVYLLKIRYSYTDEKICQSVEPIMHIVAILFALGTASTILALDMFHDSGLWCWINATPPGCKQTYQFGYTTCDAGDGAGIFRWAFFYVPIWSVAIVAIVSMAMIYRHVRQLERRSSKWKFGRQTTASDCDDASFFSHPSMQSVQSLKVVRESVRSSITKTWKQQRSRKKQKADKAKMVAGQGIRYCAVFFFTWSFGTVSRMLQLTIGHTFFPISALQATFTPMQGFFNFLVFMYPRYQEYRAMIGKQKERKRKHQQMLQETASNQANDTKPTTPFYNSASQTAPKMPSCMLGETGEESVSGPQDQAEGECNNRPLQVLDRPPMLVSDVSGDEDSDDFDT